MTEEYELQEYFIDEERANERYGDLVLWFCSRAHRFTLSCRDNVNWSLSTYEVLEELEPFLITQERRNYWPGVQLKGSLATIFVYRCEPGAARVLLKHAESFEDWMPVVLPEDLIFYRENDYWMFRYRTIHSVLLSDGEHQAFEREFPGFLTPYSSVP